MTLIVQKTSQRNLRSVTIGTWMFFCGAESVFRHPPTPSLHLNPLVFLSASGRSVLFFPPSTWARLFCCLISTTLAGTLFCPVRSQINNVWRPALIFQERTSSRTVWPFQPTCITVFSLHFPSGIYLVCVPSKSGYPVLCVGMFVSALSQLPKETRCYILVPYFLVWYVVRSALSEHPLF